jgi:hypothetical protein
MLYLNQQTYIKRNSSILADKEILKCSNKLNAMGNICKMNILKIWVIASYLVKLMNIQYITDVNLYFFGNLVWSYSIMSSVLLHVYVKSSPKLPS